MPSREQLIDETRYLIRIYCLRMASGCETKRKVKDTALELLQEHERLGALIEALQDLENGMNFMDMAKKLNAIENCR